LTHLREAFCPMSKPILNTKRISWNQRSHLSLTLSLTLNPDALKDKGPSHHEEEGNLVEHVRCIPTCNRWWEGHTECGGDESAGQSHVVPVWRRLIHRPAMSYDESPFVHHRDVENSILFTLSKGYYTCSQLTQYPLHLQQWATDLKDSR